SSENVSCLVCSVPINCLHLNMNTCRACACFFKRATLRGKRYPCRRGSGKCELIKDGHRMCRGCRYEKCVAVGLYYDGPTPPALPLQPSTLLQRISTEYKSLCERRRLRELQIIKAQGQQRRIPHPTQEVYSVHIDNCYPIFYASGVETYSFFMNIFPGLQQLNPHEQLTIYKDYAAKFGMLDCYRQTKMLWKVIGGRFSMCSMVTCYDAETGLDGDRSRIENLPFLTSSAVNYASEQSEIFFPLFNRIELTEEEAYALMAIVLFETGDVTNDLSDEALALLAKYRDEALRELQDYYREELGLDDFSRRLGNLMTLNHTIQECKSLFNVFLRFVVTVFDPQSSGKSMKEMLE
ncbi:hypothetical protein PMAYCL1PPCAC_19176, partial [Pristionchus mayeri]